MIDECDVMCPDYRSTLSVTPSFSPGRTADGSIYPIDLLMVVVCCIVALYLNLKDPVAHFWEVFLPSSQEEDILY